jgi:predicted nucleotidyltransferase
MDRQTALSLLAQHKPALQSQFGVSGLALFGSTVRGTAKEGSDVDVWVTFSARATSKQYFGARFYLEDVLKCPVDLVTDKALRQELRPFIEREAVHV